jgi:phenylacetate-CoA ligase
LPHENIHLANQHGLMTTLWDVWRAHRRGEETIAVHREQRLGNLIEFARTYSRFYRDLYKQYPYDMRHFRELPPVSKADLMKNFDDWVTDPTVRRVGVETFVTDTDRIGDLYLDQYAIWTSSGTTGTPGIFVQDKGALRVYAALALMRGLKVWITPANLWAFLWQGIRAGVVIATGGHWASDAVKEQIRGLSTYLSDRIHTFSVVEPLPQVVKSLNERRPTILFGYPTALNLLAEKQASGALKISPLLVASAAERLTSGVHGQITSAFGSSVREVYAAAEFMGIAYSCDHGWLHVNCDWLILEPVNEAYEPVPSGQPSHTVLLTNLANRIQPIIRYDLGDSITVNPIPCRCGSHMPAIHVEGRSDDVLYLQATNGTLIPVLPMALETVVELIPGVKQYQILQTAPAKLSLRVEGPSQLGEVVVRRIQEYLGTVGLTSIRIELSLQPPIRDPVSGKYQYVKADLRLEDNLD